MTFLDGSPRHWKALFQIYLQDGLAYRASGIIWVMTDVATAVTMPLVWAAAAGSGPIQGYTKGLFVLYYLSMLLLGNFVTCHFMWDISWEIKDGMFSTYLVRPVPFFQLMLIRNVAWRIIRFLIFLPFFLVLLWLYWGQLDRPTVYLGWEFWVALLLGHFVSFSFVMMFSMIALFVTEATSIFELYYIPMLFLSGQLFPVSLLPEWARTIAILFPFYYTTGLPTEVLIGRVAPADALRLIPVQLLWIALSYIGHRLLWRQGLKRYTGVGM